MDRSSGVTDGHRFMDIYMTSIHKEVLVSFLSSQTAYPLASIGERAKIDVGGCSEMVG